MNNMDWDREVCLQLIDLYKLKPEIWQVTHKYYRNKIKKNDAWIEIAQDMGYHVSLIKSKMNSLLSSFRRERAKEEHLAVIEKGKDEIYVSKWYAYESFRFLMDNNCRKAINTSQKKNNLQEEISEIEVSEKIADDEHAERDNMIEDKYIIDTEVVDISSENLENASLETTTNIDFNIDLNESDESIFVSPKAKKRKLKSKSDFRFAKAFGMLQTRAERDASEVYGEHIAMKLRTYSKRTQSVVQHLFNNILFNADMGHYDQEMNMNAIHSNVRGNNASFTSGTS